MKIILAVTLALGAAQASALDCAAPDPIRAFQVASNSTSQYLILKGVFAFDPAELPAPEVSSGLVLPQPIAATFQGLSMNPDGFTNPISGPITVMPGCLGGICGGMPAGTEVIAFARLQDTKYIIDAEPCSAWVFTSDPVTEAALTACVNGQVCVPASN